MSGQSEGNKLVVCIDDKKRPGRKVKTFENPSEELLKLLNKQGYGIFETANLFAATAEQIKTSPGYTKRQIPFLTKLNGLFADIDICKDGDGTSVEEREKRKREIIEKFNNYCPPTEIVITKNGIQPHWKLNVSKVDTATQEEYVNIINGVIEWSKERGAKGDPVKDVTHVFRKPGYLHQKSDPYLITEEKGIDKTYTLDELKKYFWFEPNSQATQVLETKPESNDPIYRAIAELDIKQVVIDVWKAKGHEAHFDDVYGHLFIDGVETATFKGRKNDGNFIATSSSGFPAKGTAITYTAQTLEMSNKEAFKWLINKYGLGSEERTKNKPPKWQFQSMDNLLKSDLPDVEYTVKQLVPEGAITMITGEPGVMKSIITNHVTIQIYKGEKVFGHFETKKSKIALIDAENGERNLKKRYTILGGDGTDIQYLADPEPALKFIDADMDEILEHCVKGGITVVIFDSYIRFLGEKDENSSSDTADTIRLFKKFIKHGITVIFLQHHRKAGIIRRSGGQEVRGSGDLLAGVNSHLLIEKSKDTLKIKQIKLREDKPVDPFTVKITESENPKRLELQYEGTTQEEESTLEQAKNAIVDILNQSVDPLYTTEISDAVKAATGIGKHTSDKALKEALKEGVVIKDPHKHERNKQYYTVSDVVRQAATDTADNLEDLEPDIN